MRETNAPFGGEVSGHFYFRDNYFADSGLIAAVIGIYAAGLTGKSLSELRTLYTPYPIIDETNFKVEDKDRILDTLKSTFADGSQDTLDGLTIELPNGSWFNVRASNTEPVLRLNAEAKTQSELDELVAKVTQIITS
jgi:phosphomannomutase